MRSLIIASLVALSMVSFGQSHGHAASQPNQLKEKSTYVWTGNEEWDTYTGFGKLEPMVRMMILMMVGGSGMEGMKMLPMEMIFNEANFLTNGEQVAKSAPDMKVEAKLGKPIIGDNNITITITTHDGKPVEKAKVTASVGMTNMDMGTSHPTVKELGKGRYAVSAKFSMMGPWRLTLSVAIGGKPPVSYSVDFEAK